MFLSGLCAEINKLPVSESGAVTLLKKKKKKFPCAAYNVGNPACGVCR